MATKYPKESTLYIRVDPDLKTHLKKQAEAVGLKLSSWARMKLVEVSKYEKAEQKKDK